MQDTDDILLKYNLIKQDNEDLRTRNESLADTYEVFKKQIDAYKELVESKIEIIDAKNEVIRELKGLLKNPSKNTINKIRIDCDDGDDFFQLYYDNIILKEIDDEYSLTIRFLDIDTGSEDEYIARNNAKLYFDDNLLVVDDT